MTAIAAVFHRDLSSCDESGLRRVLDTMRHRGPDGTQMASLDAVALGCQHFWTTPEDVDQEQPVVSQNRRWFLLFSGRIDNRRELTRHLDLDEGLEALSDARLFLAAFQAWGSDGFARILGPYAVAIYDHLRQRLTLARDPLGGRELSYWIGPRCVVVASEVEAVLAHPAVPVELDERRLAIYYALADLDDNRTFFRQVRFLLPAEILEIGATESRRSSFWSFDPTAPFLYKSSQEYAEHFRELLSASIRCRMRARETPAVLMSGGLDSTSIAALAASELGAGERLRTFSWIFDQKTSCDERFYLASMYERWPLAPVEIPCDDAWPLSDFASWPCHPTTPEQNAYRWFHQRAFVAAQARGQRVLLSGMCGDQLYSGAEPYVAELLRRGEYGRAVVESLFGLTRPVLLLRSLSRLIFPRGLRHSLGRRQQLPWLTPYARRLLPSQLPWPPEHEQAQRPAQVLRLLGLMNGHGLSVETTYASPYQVELRYPFRDRRLVELMLRAPTDQLYARGVRRIILRNALAGILPDRVRQRSDKTSFAPLFAVGVYSRQAHHARRLLFSAACGWPRYVQGQWLRQKYRLRSTRHVAALVSWFCLCHELWLERSHMAKIAYESSETRG